MSDVNHVDKGIAILKQATEKDNASQFEEALDLYQKGLDWFTLAVKYEKNAERKKQLQGHMEKYVERAEYIKDSLNKNKHVNDGGGAASRKRGDGDKDDDKEDKAKMRKQMESAIIAEKPNVKWEDVAGLEGAKEALKEAVILPITFPHLFQGPRKPWKGILLYGPPGTGKSYLAKAVATEANATFYSVSSADLVSKWLGESEKLVRTMFEMARETRPAIVFIDEIDSLCSARSDQESESSRRIKTEFLVQMQGVGNGLDGVLVLAATNLPWNIDSAIRRRFEKRIYIPLPDTEAREEMFRLNVQGQDHLLTEDNFKYLGEKTEGFSGSDIAITVRDAIMQPVRVLLDATHFKVVRGEDPMKPESGEMRDDLLMPCSGGDPQAFPLTLMEVPPERLHPPPVTFRDFRVALLNSRPSVGQEDLETYVKFTHEFGQEG